MTTTSDGDRTATFRDAVLQAKLAAYRDSNDTEIDLLQSAVSIACAMLGVNESEILEENPLDGHCDECGCPCDEHGCMADRTHEAAIPG